MYQMRLGGEEWWAQLHPHPPPRVLRAGSRCPCPSSTGIEAPLPGLRDPVYTEPPPPSQGFIHSFNSGSGRASLCRHVLGAGKPPRFSFQER